MGIVLFRVTGSASYQTQTTESEGGEKRLMAKRIDEMKTALGRLGTRWRRKV